MKGKVLLLRPQLLLTGVSFVWVEKRLQRKQNEL